jgi:ribosomal protein L20A (L18A)
MPPAHQFWGPFQGSWIFTDGSNIEHKQNKEFRDNSEALILENWMNDRASNIWYPYSIIVPKRCANN